MWVMSFTLGLALLSGKALKFFGEVDYMNVLYLIGLMGSFYMGKDFYSMLKGRGANQATINEIKNEVQKNEGAEPPV
jgi:hypothetical protein